MEDTKLFHEITTQLQPVLPQDWEKVCLFAEVAENNYQMFYYVFVKGQGKAVQCYDLIKEYQISEGDIDAVFASLAQLLRVSKTENRQTWTVFTFVLSAEGVFQVDYDYDDHIENMFAYKREWKKKYLSM